MTSTRTPAAGPVGSARTGPAATPVVRTRSHPAVRRVVTGRHRPAVLVSLLAGGQAGLAVAVSPVGTAVVGVVGAVLLGTCAWWPPRARRWRGRSALTLGALGVLPFAVLTWTALAGPVAAVLATGLLAVAVHSARSPATGTTGTTPDARTP